MAKTAKKSSASSATSKTKASSTKAAKSTKATTAAAKATTAKKTSTKKTASSTKKAATTAKAPAKATAKVTAKKAAAKKPAAKTTTAKKATAAKTKAKTSKKAAAAEGATENGASAKHEKKMDKLVALGKEQGYLTYDQVNKDMEIDRASRPRPWSGVRRLLDREGPSPLDRDIARLAPVVFDSGLGPDNIANWAQTRGAATGLSRLAKELRTDARLSLLGAIARARLGLQRPGAARPTSA